MKKLAAVFFSLCLGATCVLAQSTTRVKTHVKKKGTVVHTHRRTKPNKIKSDNYSTRGNRNPYTGKKGTKKAY